MRVRFTVRADDDDAGKYGVWDGAVNGWRSRHLADEPEATREAAQLELQYDAHGARSPQTVRRFDNAKPAVQINRDGSWSPPGKLHAWLHTDGQWYGLVEETETRRQCFIPGKDLRLNMP